MAEPGLKHRAFSAVAWSIVRYGGDQFFNFVVFAAMARFLAPVQFGVFVVALVFVEAGKILATAGLVNSIYRAEELTPKLLDTVFWANIGLGVLVAVIGVAFSQPIAIALGSPDAGPIIAVLGFVVPISALGASHMSRNLREFGHRALAIRSVLAGIIGGTVALVALTYGYGIWALVFQRFIVETINTMVAWFSFRWRPGRAFSWSTLKAQLGLGGSMAGSQLMMMALVRSQDVILARGIGPAAVGTYRTAWKTIELVSQGVITPFSTVALPTLSKLQLDAKAFQRAYLRMVGASALASYPALVGAGVLADQIIPVLYGSQWQKSIPVAQVLTLLVLPYSLEFFCDPALVVLKKSSLIFRMGALKLILTLTFCIAAAPYGIVAVAGAYVARTYLTMIAQLIMFRHVTGLNLRTMLGSVAPQLAASVVMALMLAGLGYAVPAAMFPATMTGQILRLAIFVLVGGLVYAPSLFIMLGATRRRDLLSLVSSLRKGKTAVAI